MKPKEFGLSQTKEPKESPKEAKETKDAKGAAGKPRVYALAVELNLESKAVLDICKELGFSAITSQLKALEPDQVDAIKNRVKRGPVKAGQAAPAAGKPTLRWLRSNPSLKPRLSSRLRPSKFRSSNRLP